MLCKKGILLVALITVGFIAYVRSIAAGRRTIPGDAPWQVQLRYKPSTFGNASSFLCGGTLVNSPYGDQIIITSRQCVTKSKSSKDTYQPNQLVVIAGRVSLDKENAFEQVQQVSRVEVHPDWRYLYGTTRVMHHDIALLILSYQFDLNRLVSPLALPQYTDVHPDLPGYVIISGWGYTGPYTSTHSSVLMWSSLDIVDWKECNLAYYGIYTSESNPIPRACFCAGKIGSPYYQGGCPGDQGGAGVSVQNNTLYLTGILSWSQPKCGNRYQPTVFTTTSYYMRWILKASNT